MFKNDMISLRQLTHNDTDAIAQLMATSHNWQTTEHYSHALTKGCHLWGAFDNTQLVGITTRNPNPLYRPFIHQNIPAIQDLYIAPAYRRQGIASSLLDTAEAGCDVIGLSVNLRAEDMPALTLYLKRGYLPDSHGLTKNGEPIPAGDPMIFISQAKLYLTKQSKDNIKS